MNSVHPKDAERYNIKFANQYFRYPLEDIPEELTSDCFFCGLAKNRIHELQALKELLETNALTCNFIIPETAKEGISYAEYLKQLSLSRCVIDINQSYQTGLTRRPLEALFYNKKLITNNADIRRYNFYNPKNIFIFGIDSTEFLKEFVKSPVDKIPEQIRQQYDINTWIDQYFP